MARFKKYEKSMKTPGNSDCKDIFVILFSGEMVKVLKNPKLCHKTVKY